MMWHSENVMNCHSTWFNIDCKHLHTDPKTYAILLSNQSAARALLFVWSDSFFFILFFAHFVPQVVAHLSCLIVFFLPAVCDPMLPTPTHLSFSTMLHIQFEQRERRSRRIVFVGGGCQVSHSRKCENGSYAHANAMRKSSSPLHVLL